MRGQLPPLAVRARTDGTRPAAAGRMPSNSNSTPPPRRLLERVADELRLRHYSPGTCEAYVGWVRRFVLFHGRRHPSTLGRAEVTAFLSSLATDARVSASTQNQA